MQRLSWMRSAGWSISAESGSSPRKQRSYMREPMFSLTFSMTSLSALVTALASQGLHVEGVGLGRVDDESDDGGALALGVIGGLEEVVETSKCLDVHVATFVSRTRSRPAVKK